MIALALLSLVAVAQEDYAPPTLDVIPAPRFVQPRFAPLVISPEVRIVAAEDELTAQAEVLRDLLLRRTGIAASISEAPAKSGDILLTTGYIADPIAKHPEAFSIEVFGDHVAISGASRVGVARAIPRFLQLIASNPESGAWMLPPVRIDDAPSHDWRGLMLDLARFPHPMEDVEDAVELAYLMSFNRVHLHLSDNQAFTFPTSLLPPRTAAGANGPNRGYTKAEIQRLVAFCHAREITLIPEIDMPAHSSALVRARPDLFGTKDAETGEWRSLGFINIASETARDATKALVTEVAKAFPHSPYFHLGGDEFWGPPLLELPEYAAFAAENELPGKDEGGAVNANLCHFLIDMCAHVREIGREPILWEGFRPTGVPATTIPKDVLVMAWNQHSYKPEALLEAGHSIVNCGWDPLYIVPAQGWAARHEEAYDWSPNVVRQRYGGHVTPLPKGAANLGAQVCYWEQRPESLVPTLVRLLPPIAERMWGSEAAPATLAELPVNRVVGVVDGLLRPVAIEGAATKDGALYGAGTAFRGTIAVGLSSSSPVAGTIRFEIADDFGSPVTNASKAWSGEPLVIDATKVVTAAYFGDGGRMLGAPTIVRFEQGVAVLHAQADLNLEGSKAGRDDPNWVGAGVLLRPTAARIHAINRELFARVSPDAHVDTRLLAFTVIGSAARVDTARPRVWGQHRIDAQGQIAIPVSGEWTITCRSNDGRSTLRIGGVDVVDSAKGERVAKTGTLAAGTYAFSCEHIVTGVHNELQVWLDGPNGEHAHVPLVDMLLPLDAQQPADALSTLESFGGL